jgi:AcrR family transcriptional regulator
MPRIVDHAEQRRNLLQGCFEIFARKGFSNVTVRELATELGVSTGTLYHYFPTKVEILKQLFVWAVDQDVAELGRRARVGEASADTLAGLAAFWSDRQEHYRCLLLLALDLYRHGPDDAAEALGHFAERYKQSVADSLGTDYRVGHVLYSYFLGVVAHTLLAPQHVVFQQEVDFVHEVLRAVLEVGPGDDACSRLVERVVAPGAAIAGVEDVP